MFGEFEVCTNSPHHFRLQTCLPPGGASRRPYAETSGPPVGAAVLGSPKASPVHGDASSSVLRPLDDRRVARPPSPPPCRPALPRPAVGEGLAPPGRTEIKQQQREANSQYLQLRLTLLSPPLIRIPDRSKTILLFFLSGIHMNRNSIFIR